VALAAAGLGVAATGGLDPPEDVEVPGGFVQPTRAMIAKAIEARTRVNNRAIAPPV
jgi:hypothetical protein